MKTKLVFFILLLVSPRLAFSSTDAIPPFRVPDCVGVNIHFIEPQEKQLDMIKKAGFGAIRMDFAWGHVEKEKGKYDFGGYKRLTDSLHKRDILPLYILDYSNPFYEKEQSVVTSEGRKAFAQFAASAVQAMGKEKILWEIWNEPNLDHFWKHPSPAYYVALVQEASIAMRKVDPDCTILAPATSRIHLEFLEACFDRGLLKWIDAITVHPYRSNHPETSLEEYQKLRTLLRRYPEGKDMPILSGEWGYSIHRYGKMFVDEHKQAQFLVRQFLTNFLAGVRLSIWYDWHDDGPDPNEKEHNFGTVKRDFTPKEAYKAAQVFCRQLRGMTLLHSKQNPKNGDFWVTFGKQKPEVIVAWTTEQSHDAVVPHQRVLPTATTMLGKKIDLKKGKKGHHITISQSPLYIRLAK